MAWGSSKSIDQIMRVIVRNWQNFLSQSASIAFAIKMRQKCINKFCNIIVPKVQTCHVYHGTYSRKSLTLSGNFLRLSRYFPESPETFQTLRKLSRLSGNFGDCPKTFQTVWKLSRQSGTFQNLFKLMMMFMLYFMVKFVKKRKNFPDVQKPTRRRGIWDSVLNVWSCFV